MSSMINTPIGVPSELNFNLPSSMLPSRKFELRNQPYGQSSFTSGNVVRFVIPQMQRTLYNFSTGYLTGTITFAQGGADPAAHNSFVLGSFYSMVARQVIRSSTGYVLETIDQPGLLCNCLTSMTLNASDKIAMSNSFGFNNSNGYLNVGPKVSSTQLVYNFAFPLIGLLNNDKLFPAWNGGDLEIELTLDVVSNFTIANLGTNVTGYTVSGLEYVVECLELSPESYQMVMANNPDKVVLKTHTYSYGSSSLPASQGAGTIDIPFQIKVNSLKQLIWYASPANAIDFRVGGVNPNLSNYQFISNGQAYPQRPVNVLNYSEAYMQNQKSFGAVYSNSHSGCASTTEFAISSSNLYGGTVYKAYDSVMGDNDLLTKAHKFYNCLDLESINSNKSSLYSGISTNGTSSILRMNINTALPASVHNINYWSCHDVLIVLDLQTGITSVIV